MERESLGEAVHDWGFLGGGSKGRRLHEGGMVALRQVAWLDYSGRLAGRVAIY
jgi:hypothetical protein